MKSNTVKIIASGFLSEWKSRSEGNKINQNKK